MTSFLATFRAFLFATTALAQAQTYTYKSRPDLTPVIFNITHQPAESYNPGYYLVCPSGSDVAQPSPAIYTSTGELVWSGAAEFGGCADFKVQNFNGEDVLTFSAILDDQLGHGEHGQALILNSAYNMTETVLARTPTGNDFHEFMIPAPAHDTAILTSYFPVTMDLAAVGGLAEGWLLESAFQEVDIATGNVVFSWNASAHVDISDTFLPFVGGNDEDSAWDFFHINSATKDSEGNYLINSRHFHSVYKIDGTSGAVMWTLGGKKSDFTIGEGATFAWEHCVRWIEEGSVLSLFDNENGGFPGSTGDHARGLILDVDVEQKTASARQEYLPPVDATSPSQGSVALQLDGNVVVGWGANPWISEYNMDGTLIFAAALGGPMIFVDSSPIQNYRTFKTRSWIGRPSTVPDVVMDNRTVYVSWNGATEVLMWEVMAGSASNSLVAVAKGPKTGFETVFSLTGAPTVVQVRGYNGDSMLLGESPLVMA